MRITASMEAPSQDRHRWSVMLFASEAPRTSDPRASYGSRIGGGETQRIDAAAVKTDCLCQVSSDHETSEGWEADTGEVTLDSPDDLAICFRRPGEAPPSDRTGGCVLAFEFTPAIRGESPA
jgi:hypothetical protein